MRWSPWLSALAAFGVLLLLEASQGAAYTETQYERGLRIYETTCAKCHGINGEGDPDSGVPAHKGGKILNDFKSIQNMVDFIKGAMPADNRGSLSLDDAYAVATRIMAFNGWEPDGVELNASTAPSLVLGAPGQAQPDQTQSGQTQPDQAQPGQAQPDLPQPGQTQPGQAQPGQAQPGQAQPGQAQPSQTPPGPDSPGQPPPAIPASQDASGLPGGLLWALLGVLGLAVAGGAWRRFRRPNQE